MSSHNTLLGVTNALPPYPLPHHTPTCVCLYVRPSVCHQYSDNPAVTRLWKEWEAEQDVLLIREEASATGQPLLKMMRVEFDVRFLAPWRCGEAMRGHWGPSGGGGAAMTSKCVRTQDLFSKTVLLRGPTYVGCGCQEGDSDGSQPHPTFVGRVYGVTTGNIKESRMSWEEAEASQSQFVKDAVKVRGAWLHSPPRCCSCCCCCCGG